MFTLAHQEEILDCPLNVTFLTGTLITGLGLWAAQAVFDVFQCLLHQAFPKHNSLDARAWLKYC